MKIRTILLAASVPLITLLAVVNGLLYFYQSRAEMRDGLDQRALAAAVSGAEFLAEMRDPQQILDDDMRRRAVQTALDYVQDLEAYDWVRPDGQIVGLQPGSAPWNVPKDHPGAAQIYPMMTDNRGRHYVAAAASAGPRGYVAVRMDAEPMLARLEQVKLWIYGAIGLALLIGLAVGSYLARRIGRELQTARKRLLALDRGEASPDVSGLRLTEAADLAGALRLIDLNRSSEQQRLADTLNLAAQWDEGQALRLMRAEAFPARQWAAGDWSAAICVTEQAALGTFYALCGDCESGGVVIGECAADTGLNSFAAARAARSFIEQQWSAIGLDAAAARAAQIYGASRIEILSFGAADGMAAWDARFIADASAQERVANFRRAGAGLEPILWIQGAVNLCEADGIFVSVSRNGRAALK